MDPLILDGLDRQLVHALQVDGRAPFSRIAAVLGASDRTVARRYRRLREAGALRVVGLPDAAALGHVDWLVRMRCSPDTALPVAAALARRDDTSWVTLVSGGTEITCITRTRGQSADGELLLQKLPRTPRITVLSAHCMLRGVAGLHGWPGRTAALDAAQIAALRPAPAAPASTGAASAVAPPAVPAPTTADNRLLAALAKDGRAGLPALAAATGWSETTVRRRLDELCRGGVLYFDVEIEPALLGYTAEAMMWLTVAPAALTATTQALAGHPQIAYAAATTGPANVAASVICRDLHELYEYIAGDIGSLTGVTSVETAPVVRRVKSGGTLLVP
ncbi:Lrp/AsnC family transcriptional regulator [Dactylosporangium aurantiacum]|uniref:Lrp/AsnC family transcriptional regulator n=1 Tax=Dactylosporangium aurantiacum TaxID=35754 RepID=A0A9Q9IBK5_9ACTN|nr:Lrp/AsnC family transcriptional regulator [Dactylosporangium aurantiacum]MDG6110082.1 Lrp/AsnC family transcriptional regulator [Dactylosporangium aurantiacum]UWZ51333.1 Lrp/AsnC family transcriptional regulator [Dactylosporangium aurantiacum]